VPAILLEIAKNCPRSPTFSLRSPKSDRLLVRFHVEKGETSVYFAADKPGIAGMSKTMGMTEKPVEISMDEVMRIE
jgi:hypothetical protein